MFGFMLVSGVLAILLNSTAATAMLMPVIHEIIESIKARRRNMVVLGRDQGAFYRN